MADTVDEANNFVQDAQAKSIQAIREDAAKITPGEPGECYQCGEFYTRIVRGACAQCRDLLGLP